MDNCEDLSSFCRYPRKMATHWVAISLGMTIMTLNETSPLRTAFRRPEGCF